MTPGDPLARRAQYFLPRESLGDLKLFSLPEAGTARPVAVGQGRGVSSAAPILHMSFERIGAVPIAGPAAASTDVPLAAARPRARMGGQSGGPFLEIRDVAFALLDIFTLVFGLAFLALYVGAVAFAIFILLVAVQ